MIFLWGRYRQPLAGFLSYGSCDLWSSVKNEKLKVSLFLFVKTLPLSLVEIMFWIEKWWLSMVPILFNLYKYVCILLLKLKYIQWSVNAYHLYRSRNLYNGPASCSHHPDQTEHSQHYRKLSSFCLSISTFLPPNPEITTILSSITVTVLPVLETLPTRQHTMSILLCLDSVPQYCLWDSCCISISVFFCIAV